MYGNVKICVRYQSNNCVLNTVDVVIKKLSYANEIAENDMGQSNPIDQNTYDQSRPKYIFL